MWRLRPLDRVLLISFGSIWLVFFALHIGNIFAGRLAEPSVYVEAPQDRDGYPVVRSLRVGAPAYSSGLEPGDRLIRIGSSDLAGMGPLGFFAHAMQALGADQSATVVFRRAGEVREIELHFTPLPLPIRFIVLSVSFGLVGVLLILRAPRNRAAVAIFRAFVIIGAGFLRPWGGAPAQTYGWLVIAALLTPVFAPLVIFACRALRTEERRSWLWRLWPWIFAPVGPTYISGIVGLPLFGSGSNLADPISMAMLLLLGITIIVEFTISYRRSDAIGRRQIKWIGYGIYVSLVPVLIATSFSLTDPELWWLSDASEIFEFLIPIAVFIAIVRFNLFDIDRVISATASYSLILVLAVPAAVTLVPMVADLMSPAIGLDPWPGRIMLSVGIAAVSLPIQRRLNPLIDRYLFPERREFEDKMLELLEDLSHAESPTELAMQSSSRIDEILRPESSASYIRTDRGYANVFFRGHVVPPLFDLTNPIISVLRARGKPLVAERWTGPNTVSRLSPFDRAALETIDAAVLIPVRRGNELLAFMCMGPKRSGDVYTATELALLGAVGDKVAAEIRRFDEAEVIRQSREMQNALRRYVPGAIAEELDGRDEIPSRECEVSVLFVDIRGYSSFSEHRLAEEIFSTVNRYTEAVSAIIRRHGGSVVEFNGDGMMAVFGAPRELAAKERAAVEAGREIIRSVREIEVGQGPERTKLSVGVGIATGTAFVGNIRAVDRLIWSAIGNTTNRAARLEAQTRTLDVAMVIDAGTRKAAGPVCADFEIRRGLSLKGYREAVDVYVLAAEEP